jgi:hypothetical protein
MSTDGCVRGEMALQPVLDLKDIGTLAFRLILDDTTTFLGPYAHQIRNAHSYLKNFEEEKDMHSQTEALVVSKFNIG